MLKVFCVKNLSLLSLLSWCFIIYQPIQCFSAHNLTALESALHREYHRLRDIRRYVESEEKRVLQLRALFDGFTEDNRRNLNDMDAYLGHPLDAYLVIRRLSTEWKQIQQLLSGTKLDANYYNTILDRDALEDAAKGIAILVDTYQLDIVSMAAAGVVHYRTQSGLKAIPQTYDLDHMINAMDCYLIGKKSFIRHEYNNSIKWFKEAIKTLDDPDTRDNNDHLRANVTKYTALAYYHLGDFNQTKQYANKAIKLTSTHDTEAFQFNILLDQLITMSNKTVNNMNAGNNGRPKGRTNYSRTDTDYPYEVYVENPVEVQRIATELCRGVKHMDPAIERQLKCYHLNTAHKPYVRLQRIKTEEVSKEPQIVVFREFLSERQMQAMRALSKPRPMPVRVGKGRAGQTVYETRFGVNGHNYMQVYDSDDPAVRAVSRRIGAVTGLDLFNSTPYWGYTYRIGGHTSYHYDVDSDGTTRPETYHHNGHNRIATLLAYVDSMSAGGATVFPVLGVRIEPEKGSAVFWYNLKRSGRVDEDTLHTGCPSLVGIKRIALKWVCESSQQLTCAKDMDERYFLN